MKTNYKSIILIIGGMTFMFAIEKILSNLLHAIIYGIAYMLILGSFIYQNEARITFKKKLILYFIGIALLVINNILVIQNVSAAIFLSLSFVISLSGVYFFGFFVNNSKKDI